MDGSRITTHIKPLIGAKTVGGLRRSDVETMQYDIASGKTAKPRVGGRGGTAAGGNGVAARTISTLHSIFEHALRLEVIETNPARGVRKLSTTPRERRLSTSEIMALGGAMKMLASEGEHATGLAAIRLLILTGFRRLEGLALQRDWFDPNASCVRFPDTKSGAQTRAIGEAACDLINSRLAVGSSPYVFPADWGSGHFIGIIRVLDRVCARAGLEAVTPHVLRHTFGSIAGDLGFSELIIAAMLGHAPRGVTQRYVHIEEPIKIAANRVSSEIAKLLDHAGVVGRAKDPSSN